MKGFMITTVLTSPGRRDLPAAQEGPKLDATSSDGDCQCPQLTVRENDVIRCFSCGLLYKETADELRMSYSAVHKHQHKAFRKLGVANRTEAIRKWWAMGGR